MTHLGRLAPGPLLASIALLAAVAACSGPSEPPARGAGARSDPTTAVSPAPTTPAGVKHLDLTLDEVGGGSDELGDGAVLAAGPSRFAVVRAEGSGRGPLLVPGRDGRGRALRLVDGSCRPDAPSACRKALLVVQDDDPPPGDGHFAYGAAILMTPQETSKGANVLQRGFSTDGGGQWKLQVDGTPGRPSCVVVGTGSSDIHVAKADVSVADGRWHELSCQRSGARLEVLVDGARRGVAELPPGLDVSPSGPLRIGGKSTREDNDQFLGVLDEVFLLGDG